VISQPLNRMARYACGAAVTWSLVACGGGAELDAAEQTLADENRSQALARDPVAATAAATTATGSIQLASSTAGGTPANASSTTCALSADGHKLLFSSDASNLVAGDSNRTSDLFLKDLVSGTVTRVTTQSNGAQITAGGNCLGTTMTPDGRIVAFNSGQAVFAKNTQTGLLTQASPPASTVPQVTGFFGGVVSDDGTKLVFLTLPETVYAGAYQFNNVIPARLMLRDLGTGSLVTLATDNGIVQQGQIVSNRFAISPDGTQVAFVSSSASLVSGDTNARPDVFVRDLVSGGTVLVSSSSDGAASGGVQYWNPTFVSNTQVAFGTGQPSGLGASGLYLKDLATGTLTLVLSNSDGGADAVLSGDGRKVAFGQLYGSGFDRRVFVRDRITGQQTLVSASSSGVASNGQSTGAVISRDGTRVAFGSNARNLVSPRPPADLFQIYAKDVAGVGTAVQ
jgi:Tol biopolymer transport system component